MPTKKTLPILISSLFVLCAALPQAQAHDPERLLRRNAKRMSRAAIDFHAALRRANARFQLVRAAENVANRTQKLAGRIERNAPKRRQLRSLERLDGDMRDLRRRVHNQLRGNNERLLGSWYELSYRYEFVRRRLRRGGGHVTPPDPRKVRMFFKGTLGNIDVAFDGFSHQELYTSCQKFMGPRGRQVRLVSAFGKRYKVYNRMWSPDAQCAIVALNARFEGRGPTLRVTGTVENAPVDIHAQSLKQLRIVARAFGPKLVSGNARHMQLHGKKYRLYNTVWKPRAVGAILAYSVGRNQHNFIARGNVEGSPFVFTGSTRSDIRGQCEAYARDVVVRPARALEVNGKKKRNYNSTWSPGQVCMNVSALAVPQRGGRH